jgi:hypothetical protein
MLRKMTLITAILLSPELASAQFTYYLLHVIHGSIPGTGNGYKTASHSLLRPGVC